MKDPDDLSYLKFTGPGQRDKAVNTLKGILQGMWVDGHINPAEAKELKNWCAEHSHLLKRVPFIEIIPKLLNSLADGKIDPEEYKDIMWVVENSLIENEYYQEITTSIQELQGMIHGITADGKIERSELEGLYQWMQDREYLKGVYPYDEIESLIVGTLRDGVIDEKEHAALLAFFDSFVSYSLSKRVTIAREAASRGDDLPKSIKGGLCALDPEIIFKGKTFVFTGKSEKAPRKIIADHISVREGKLSENVDTSHYLVVGNDGNRAWAFACYGRKVEKAMQLRRQGKGIVIVNEVDFWDAVAD